MHETFLCGLALSRPRGSNNGNFEPEHTVPGLIRREHHGGLSASERCQRHKTEQREHSSCVASNKGCEAGVSV